MYMVTTAARIRNSVLDSELLKASAAPWKLVSTLMGRSSFACSALIACTASPSATAGGRLNEIVAAGNCATWLIASAAGRSTICATELSGTCTVVVAAVPVALVVVVLPGTYSPSSARGPLRNSDAASSTTRYWLACV